MAKRPGTLSNGGKGEVAHYRPIKGVGARTANYCTSGLVDTISAISGLSQIVRC